jgi:flagellar hook-associated protein 1
MSGLFSIFNVANRGMATQQKAINVTSHNIANANTAGYSRQRATIETTRPFGMPSLNNTAEPGQLGTGSQVSAIERVRDSFLDYQVRVETSTDGQFQARDKFLSEIENIFNEPSDTGISTLIGKFFDSWHELAGNAQSSNSRTIVVQQSAALADALNHTATQLTKLKENTQSVIKDTVFEVNDILDQIDQLNQQIIGVKVAGQMPNDLMDRRDLLLDTLSSKFNISIDKKNFEGYDIKPVDLISDNKADNSFLIRAENNDDVRRLSYIKNIEETSTGIYKITYNRFGDSSKEVTLENVALTDDEFENLDKYRVMWTDTNGEKVSVTGHEIVPFASKNGELMGYASVQEDIDNYMTQLDQVAKALAFAVNTVHSGKTDAADDDLLFFVNSSDKAKESEITAANIAVNKELIDDVMKVKVGFSADSGSTDGSRALAIAQLRNLNMNIQNIRDLKDIDAADKDKYIISRADMFGALKDNNKYNEDTANEKIELKAAVKGMKIDNYFKDVIDRLGVQGGEAKRMVKNQQTLLASFQQSRESVSGVSLDEEMANLIQYQHAYQANAKIISTVDELLDVVINGLKR